MPIYSWVPETKLSINLDLIYNYFFCVVTFWNLWFLGCHGYAMEFAEQPNFSGVWNL